MPNTQDRTRPPSETVPAVPPAPWPMWCAPTSIPFCLLHDDDACLEHGARGLAAACQSGNEQPLVAALAHADLAVRKALRFVEVMRGRCRCWLAPASRTSAATAALLYSFVAGAGVRLL